MKKTKKMICLVLAALTVLGVLSVPSLAAADTDTGVWAKCEDNPTLPADIKSYSDYRGERYIFLPAMYEEETVAVTFNGGITRAEGEGIVSLDETANTVTVMTDCDDARINGVALHVMKGSLPVMNVSVAEGYSLETIHRDRDAKIKASARIDGAKKDK